jgi:exopolysaccharide biosynthesis polyprenyl glycosylphosphotransferase
MNEVSTTLSEGSEDVRNPSAHPSKNQRGSGPRNQSSSPLPIGDVRSFSPQVLTPGARTHKTLVVLADWVAIYLAFVGATWLSGIPMVVGAGVREGGMFMLLAAGVGCLSYARVGLYISRNVVHRLTELRRIIEGSTIALILILAAADLLHRRVSRKWSSWAIVISVLSVIVERDMVRRLFRAARRSGRQERTVLIVGTNEEALHLHRLISSDGGLGYRVVGFVGDGQPVGTELVPGVNVVATTADIQLAARGLGVSGAIIAITSHDAATTNRCVRLLADDGFHVQVSSTLRGIATERLTAVSMGFEPMFYLNPIRRKGLTSAAKRTTDILISGAGLIATAPVLLLAAIAIRIESWGPIMFRQERAGKGGEVFRIFKLRTMVADAEQLRSAEVGSLTGENQLFFKAKQDSRITRVGSFLRRTSIDEIPQLLNILRGDMSLVGPRPLPLTDTLRAWDENAAGRLRVRPGLTGMWQVSGRSATSAEDAVRLDLYYVDNWSLWVDLAVLARTIPAVVAGRGAV